MSMKRLAELAHEQLEAEVKVTKAEEALKQAKEGLRLINEGLLPELMDELGVDNFTTTDGIKITVKEDIRASITKANAFNAIQWLRDNNHANLIKRQITVVASDDDEGTQVLAKLAGYEVSDNATVHPMTLGAFVREKLENGEEVPLDLLGVHRQRVSKVKV